MLVIRLCKNAFELGLRSYNCKYLFLRSVYSGPLSTPNFTKLPTNDDDTSWEIKKLRNLRQRVIDNNKGIKHEGDEKIVDNEHRMISSLPHMIFTDNPAKYMQDDSFNYVIGQAKPLQEKENTRTSNIDPDFARSEVQEILMRLQGKKFAKIFKRTLANYKEMPQVRLLTDEQLKEEYELSSRKANELLDMPPVMLEREPIDDILAEDDDLDGYEHCNVVFMDISEDLKRNDRFIVVREPNGKLRKAFWDERDRILQTFYTKEDRTIVKPKMFDNLQVAFENKLHANVLEQLVVQYDPDAAEYISVVEQVYENINENNLFDLLRSTRFFGGLALYLAKYTSIDNLLLFFMKEKLISEAVDVVSLYSLLKPQSETASKILRVNEDDERIEAYISCDATNRAPLLEALERLRAEVDLKTDDKVS